MHHAEWVKGRKEGGKEGEREREREKGGRRAEMSTAGNIRYYAGSGRTGLMDGERNELRRMVASASTKKNETRHKQHKGGGGRGHPERVRTAKGEIKEQQHRHVHL